MTSRSLLAALTVCAVVLAGVALIFASSAGPPTPPRLGGSATSPSADGFSYASGAAGTVTVPSGSFVTSFHVHATSAGTLVITPSGLGDYAPCVDAGADAGDAGPCASPGSSIPIPAGATLEVAIPTLGGSSTELGVGTVFTFTGTDSYLVTMRAGQ